MAAYRTTKTFGHWLGLSVAFRQWRAKHSHCRFLHGYALSVTLTYEAAELDDRKWVMDFGDFAGVKKVLCDHFDHKLVVAEDDPMKDELCSLAGLGCADVLVLPHVGCEAFAEFIYYRVAEGLVRSPQAGRVHLLSVQVSEHGANSATFQP